MAPGTTAHILQTLAQVMVDTSAVVIAASTAAGVDGMTARTLDANSDGVTLLRVVADWLLEHPDVDDELLVRYVDALP